MKDKAIFLDRDGVINELIYYDEIGIIDSPFTVKQFKLLPDVEKALKKFKKLGFKTIIVSNQPGIAKKNFTIETFEKIREKMKKELQKKGTSIDFEYYCFHHPYGKIKKFRKNCECRKPKPGLLVTAAKEHNIDLSSSWMIGDGITDIQAGNAAGCKTVLIGRMKCDLCKIMESKKVKPDFIAPNLFKASLIIQKQERK
ncbi:MAG: HAD family hydrolase [Candidatus Thermoplasmatota archaeon]|jgi:D-glycero-D-manno-heptose 1,7-bisphosphate phosphatase|nr:HAD family hydrolase [Candidatus Thermoplasmatota archaeon]